MSYTSKEKNTKDKTKNINISKQKYIEDITKNINDISTTSHNIRLAVRVKMTKNFIPFLKIEKNEIKTESRDIKYKFDKVFVKENTYEVFKYIIDFIESKRNGSDKSLKSNTIKNNDMTFNRSTKNKNECNNMTFTLLCYGYTGTGKTYTMLGKKDQKGIFHYLKDTYGIRTFKYFEIYNEKMITRTESLGDVNDFEKLLIRRGTLLNEFSSRSHTVIEMCVNEGFNVVIVDLAGCEDNRKTGNDNKNIEDNKNDKITSSLKEFSSINKSLFVLRKVMSSLKSKNKQIPYRECVLTKHLIKK